MDGNITATNDADLTATNVAAGGAGSDVTLTTTNGGNIIIVSVTAGDSIIINADGSVISGGAGGVEVSGGALEIYAINGIGDDGGIAGANMAAALKTAVSQLALHTVTGDIRVVNTGALILADVDGIAPAVAVEITGGGVNDDIRIMAASPLTINGTVTNNGGGNIALAALGNAVTDNLTINAAVTATGGSGNIDLYAGHDILVNADVTAANAGNVSAYAGEDWTDATLDQDGHAQGDIVMAAGTTFQTDSGVITLDAARNATIARLNVANNTIATPAGVVNVLARTGAILDADGPAININANTVNLWGAAGIGTAADPIEIEDATLVNLASSANNADIFVAETLNAAATVVLTAATLGVDADIDFNLVGVAGSILNPTAVNTFDGGIVITAQDADIVLNGGDAIFAGAGARSHLITQDIVLTTLNTGDIILNTGASVATGDMLRAGLLPPEAGYSSTTGSILLTSAGWVMGDGAGNGGTVATGDASADAGIGTTVAATSGQIIVNAVNGIEDIVFATGSAQVINANASSGADPASSGNINLNGSHIGTAANALSVAAGVPTGGTANNTGDLILTTTGIGAAGDIYVTSASRLELGLITTDASVQTVDIQTTGGADLVNVVANNLVGDTVILTGDRDVLFDANFSAGDLTVNAGRTIDNVTGDEWIESTNADLKLNQTDIASTGASAIGTSASPLLVQVPNNSLVISTVGADDAGDIFVRSTQDLSLGLVTTDAATSQTVVISTAAGNLVNDAANILANDTVTLNAAADALFDENFTAQALTVIAGGVIDNVTGDEVLTAPTMTLTAVDGIGQLGDSLDIVTSTLAASTTGANADIFLANAAIAPVTATLATAGAGADITYDQTGNQTLGITSATTVDGNIIITNDDAAITATLVNAGGAANGNVWLFGDNDVSVLNVSGVNDVVIAADYDQYTGGDQTGALTQLAGGAIASANGGVYLSGAGITVSNVTAGGTSTFAGAGAIPALAVPAGIVAVSGADINLGAGTIRTTANDGLILMSAGQDISSVATGNPYAGNGNIIQVAGGSIVTEGVDAHVGLAANGTVTLNGDVNSTGSTNVLATDSIAVNTITAGGGIYLDNAVLIDLVVPAATANIVINGDLYGGAAINAVQAYAMNDIFVNDSVGGQGDVVLIADADAYPGSATAGDNMGDFVQSDGLIYSNAGGVFIGGMNVDIHDDIWVNGASDFAAALPGDIGDDAGLVIAAGGNVFLDAGLIITEHNDGHVAIVAGTTFGGAAFFPYDNWTNGNSATIRQDLMNTIRTRGADTSIDFIAGGDLVSLAIDLDGTVIATGDITTIGRGDINVIDLTAGRDIYMDNTLTPADNPLAADINIAGTLIVGDHFGLRDGGQLDALAARDFVMWGQALVSVWNGDANIVAGRNADIARINLARPVGNSTSVNITAGADAALVDGFIRNSNNAVVNVVADNLNMLATTGIGEDATADDRIIRTAVTNLQAQTLVGDIYIIEQDGLTLTVAGPLAWHLAGAGLYTGDGSITLETGKTLDAQTNDAAIVAMDSANNGGTSITIKVADGNARLHNVTAVDSSAAPWDATVTVNAKGDIMTEAGSRITADNVRLTAVNGMNVDTTSVNITAANTGNGDIVIRDNAAHVHAGGLVTIYDNGIAAENDGNINVTVGNAGVGRLLVNAPVQTKGTGNVTLTSHQDMTLEARISSGGTIDLTSLNTNINLGDDVDGFGTVTFHSPVRLVSALAQETSFVTSRNGNVVFDGTIDGDGVGGNLARNLTVDAADGMAIFNGNIGVASPVGTLTVAAARGINLNANVGTVGAAGANVVKFESDVLVGNPAPGAERIVNATTSASFDQDLSGAYDVHILAGGFVSLNTVGNGDNLTQLNVDTPNLRLWGNMAVDGSILLDGAIITTLMDNVSMDTTGAALGDDILFANLTGNKGLTIKAGNADVVFGRAGGTDYVTNLDSLNVINSNTITVNSAVDMPGSIAFTANANQAGAVDINAPIGLNGHLALGAAIRPASLTVTTPGGALASTTLGADVSTKGNMTFLDAVVVDVSNRTLASWEGNITFHENLDTDGTPYTLVLNATNNGLANGIPVGAVRLNDVGQNNPFGLLDVNALSAELTGDIKINGNVDFDGAVTTRLKTDVFVDITDAPVNSRVVFNTIDGGHRLTIDAQSNFGTANNVVFLGNITQLTGLTADASNDVTFGNAAAVAPNGGIIVNIPGAVVARADNDIRLVPGGIMVVGGGVRMEANNDIHIDGDIVTSGDSRLRLLADADTDGAGDLNIGQNWMSTLVTTAAPQNRLDYAMILQGNNVRVGGTLPNSGAAIITLGGGSMKLDVNPNNTTPGNYYGFANGVMHATGILNLDPPDNAYINSEIREGHFVRVEAWRDVFVWAPIFGTNVSIESDLDRGIDPAKPGALGNFGDIWVCSNVTARQNVILNSNLGSIFGCPGMHMITSGNSTSLSGALIGTLQYPLNVTVGGTLYINATSHLLGISGVLNGTANDIDITPTTPGLIIFNGISVDHRGPIAMDFKAARTMSGMSMYVGTELMGMLERLREDRTEYYNGGKPWDSTLMELESRIDILGDSMYAPYADLLSDVRPCTWDEWKAELEANEAGSK
ncbi:MAG: hypothetical protein QMD09_01435 [Desulfatibacillaceae bacterium]|nr:hypothetical protein [Desulfatibacillaceae bacterium]